MENITFYEKINIFLENKKSRKSLAYLRRQGHVYAGLMHANVGMDLRTQLGF